MISAAYLRQRREALKAQGLCQSCGRCPAGTRKDGTPSCRCSSCRSQANRISAARLRRIRPHLKALGICVVCGTRQACPRRSTCAWCAERRAERKAAVREAAREVAP